MRILLLVISVVLAGVSSAGSCPAGAEDCFLCGGVDGIPCTTDCTGHYSEAAGQYISCECPQGEPCVCYCPYEGGEAVVGVGEGGMPPSEGADLTFFSGDVYVMPPGGQWMKVGSRIPLGEGYSIRTGKGAKATVMLDDGCKLYIDPETTLDLTELQNRPGTSTLSVVLELIKGAIYSDVTKRDGTRFEVDCGVSVAGVKGTSFAVYYDDARREAVIKAVEGAVEVSDLSAEKVNLNAGEMIAVTNNGLGDVLAFDADAEESRWVPSGGCGSAFVLGLVLLGACLAGRAA